MRTWFFDQPVTALTLTDRDDVLAVVLGSGVILWEPASDRSPRTHLISLEGWPAVRLNDARADPRGSLWVGSMRNNVNPDGSAGEAGGKDGILYRIDPDAGVHRSPARRGHLQHAGLESRPSPFLFWRFAGQYDLVV